MSLTHLDEPSGLRIDELIHHGAPDAAGLDEAAKAQTREVRGHARLRGAALQAVRIRFTSPAFCFSNVGKNAYAKRATCDLTS